MTPAGYMAKKVATSSATIGVAGVMDIYSVSGCVSGYFANYIRHWKHNGYWLFDSVEVIRALAQEHSIPLEECKIFYYEVFEQEFDEDRIEWQPFSPDDSFRTLVVPPASKRLEGYDVVTFAARTSPECSPLSCNSLAKTIGTNEHCLFRSFEDAKARIEAGVFEASEPGPFRIFAVYSVAE